ncbi:MAG: ATP synthase subunit I [Clostridia bacterium]|nr:ATP synthase subunit I [Clostridia bacterium]
MAENDAGRFILRETGVVLAGEAVCIALMLGVFALLGRLDRPVWIGAAVGLILALGNFFMMAVSAGSASERAAAQDVKGGKQLMRSSYMIRMGVIAVILFVLVRAGVCNVITSILPLLFVRWILTVAEVFRKKGRS